jgi:hypothetical protein
MILLKNIFTSIDIGSDSIKVVTYELYNNKLNLLAALTGKLNIQFIQMIHIDFTNIRGVKARLHMCI